MPSIGLRSELGTLERGIGALSMAVALSEAVSKAETHAGAKSLFPNILVRY